MKIVTALPTLPIRTADAHKGDVGRLLVVAGSLGMAGAASLVGNAALRSGAGLVKIAVPRCAQPTVAALAPCCTTVPLPDTEGGTVAKRAAGEVIELARGHDCIAIGPGLGTGEDVAFFVRAVMESIEIPALVDADGLTVLARALGGIDGFAAFAGRLVITPHPGEAARILSTTTAEVQELRQDVAGKLASPGIVAVLKGAGTIVCDGEKLYLNETGNPGMATGGAGDVLTGVISALVGQRLSLFDAAQLGVHIHGRAGDIAAKSIGQLGMTAMDILHCIPQAFLL
ncbi:MAG: NAD(P)H-hydrate dehydratase [Planctomycetia bacterium]|nr:NAD(P)H-hydrate dehydratase [Planctomycetia bacterium]